MKKFIWLGLLCTVFLVGCKNDETILQIQEDNDKLMNEMKTIEEKNDKLAYELTSLHEENNMLRNGLNNVQKENDMLHKKYNDLHAERNKLLEDLSNREEDYQQLLESYYSILNLFEFDSELDFIKRLYGTWTGDKDTYISIDQEGMTIGWEEDTFFYYDSYKIIDIDIEDNYLIILILEEMTEGSENSELELRLDKIIFDTSNKITYIANYNTDSKYESYWTKK